MKKAILVVLFTLTAIVANAQFYAGATGGISIQSVKTQGDSNTNQTFQLAPEFGYQLNDFLAVGASFAMAYTNIALDNDYSSFGISPYVRATFARAGVARFFADASFTYLYTKEHSFHTHIENWAVSLSPGVLIGLTDKLDLIGRTTLFQYSQSGKGKRKVKGIGFEIANNIELGVLFHF